MRRARRRAGSLQAKLTHTVVSIVACTFVVVFLAAGAFYALNFHRQIMNREQQALTLMARQISYTQKSVSDMARQIVVDSRVQAYVTQAPETTFKRIVRRDNMKRLLMTYANMSPYMESIIIYTGSEVFSTNQTLGILDIRDEAWYKDFEARKASSGYTRDHVETMEQGTMNIKVISYVLTFWDIGNTRQRLGELILNLNYGKFLTGVELDHTYLTGYCIFDRWGNEVYRSGAVSAKFDKLPASGDSTLLPGGDTALINRNLEDGWVMVSEVSSASVSRSLTLVGLVIVAICLAVLAGLFWMLRQRIRAITGPVKALHDAAVEIGKGNFGIRVQVDTEDEIAGLADTMNQMGVNLKNLMDETVRYEQLTREMEINRLMLQINPHFIYNTLNSIVYMASSAQNQEIERFVKAFISLLQNTLRVKSGDVFVSMRRELKNIRIYMVLQEYRYPGKLSAQVICPEDLMDCAVPNVLLQPLVENSIFHGLVPKEGPGTLRIVAQPEGGDVRVLIEDDGVGMGPEEVRRLMESQEPVSGLMHTVGFANVRQRVTHIYGEHYGVQVESRPGAGTRVSILIPYRKYEGDDA
jgi:two-component system sensor histidine kinase YesM